MKIRKRKLNYLIVVILLLLVSVCPIHTCIINHHVYKHTYRPQYTCSEENVCSNVQCGSCCQF